MKNLKKILLSLVLIFSAATGQSNVEQSDLQIVQMSILKSGTNLLSKCISFLTSRTYVSSCLAGVDVPRIYYRVTDEEIDCLTHLPENIFWQNHLLYDQTLAKKLDKPNIAKFFIYRDPRDQVVSFAFFMKNGEHWPKAVDMTFEQVLWDLILEGSTYNNEPPIQGGINSMYQAYTPWINEPNICSVKFEDLVGPNGGGDARKQNEAIKKIATHLRISISDEKVNEIANNLFGGTWTFREGQIGSWKKYFSPRHKEIFKEIAGQLLIDLGYENDMNW